jgi:putative PEP-CTERM system integral membrane protein
MNKFKKLLKFLAHSTFWGWNLIFITVFYCGILPFVGIPLILATFDGDIPFDFSIAFLTLIIVPVAATYIGFQYLRKQPAELMRLFYGVEAPLVTWCLLRLFLFRELNWASCLVLGTLLVTIFAFAVEVVQGYQQNQRVYSWLQMIAHSLMLLMGLYLGLVLVFYAIPVAIAVIGGIAVFIVGFFSFEWVQPLWYGLTHSLALIYGIIIGCLFVVLFYFSATLFVGMPSAITGLYISSGRKILLKFAQQYGKKTAIAGAVSTISIWLFLLFIFNQQPQVKAFNLLAQTPQNRVELLATSSIIQRGLVNANLYPYRYLSTQEDNNHIYSIYNNLGLPSSVASFIQQRYNQLLSPFLYQGSSQDVQESADLYGEFFDIPLQKAERKSVRHALQSTAIVDQAQAGLLNIEQKKVWLEKQEVNLTPHGDWAEVEIHEVYQNKTNDVEEILYYFSLPESAAITGLWLGESEDKTKRFAFQVSPRGAAQEVDNSQVERTRPVDPALLEQVGFGQYRLRAFPVPPRRTSQEISRSEPARKMHLWLTYKVMKQDQGWALPQLAEQRNIFWTGQTKRIRNGKTKWSFANVWLEDYLASDNNNSDRVCEASLKDLAYPKGNCQEHQINLSNGYTVAAKPLDNQSYVLPQNQTYALILDTSYSMGNHLAELENNLQWWQANLPDNDVDLYLIDSQDRSRYLAEMQDLDLKQLVFYGSISNPEMLNKFNQLREKKNYDGILLITDEGSYELTEDKQTIPKLNAPLWLIHLGGKLPRAYDDATLQALQNSQGGIAKDLATVMPKIGTETATGATVVDGYSWSFSLEPNATSTTKGLEPIAARQLVSYLSKKNQNSLSVTELDQVHQLAKTNALVTPYSSMIVLVNDEQRELLKKAEARSDRFEREVEIGVEQLNQPFNPLEVSGVPEPDFWILLIIVAIALGLIWQQQKITERN